MIMIQKIKPPEFLPSDLPFKCCCSFPECPECCPSPTMQTYKNGIIKRSVVLHILPIPPKFYGVRRGM